MFHCRGKFACFLSHCRGISDFIFSKALSLQSMLKGAAQRKHKRKNASGFSGSVLYFELIRILQLYFNV